MVKEATDGKGADVILDFVEPDYLEKNLQAVAVGRTLVQLAPLSGTRTEIDLHRFATSDGETDEISGNDLTESLHRSQNDANPNFCQTSPPLA